MRERPEPQLFLADLPQPREPARLDDQKETDQAAEDHVFEIGQDVDRQGQPEQGADAVEEQGQQGDEGGAEEGAEDAAEAAVDDSEEDLVLAVDAEGDSVEATGVD